MPKTTTNKQIINLNMTDDEQFSTNNMIYSVRSDINKNKKEIFNTNINNDKKYNNNYPYCNSSRFSINNIINKNRLKKNLINLNNNSLCFPDKENENKIYQNYNNNTCNISLNQHFYNIDYNGNIKRPDTDSKDEKNKLEIYINKNKENKSINNNKSNDKQIPYFYLNTLTNSVPVYFDKDTSNIDIDKRTKTIFLSNIIPKKNKKINKINLIKVNNKLLNINSNKSNLNNYSNIVKILNHKKNINNKNIHKTKSSSNNSFKYKKKIITYNSFIKNKDKSDSSYSNFIKNENTFTNLITYTNKSVENKKDKDIKSTRLINEMNRGNYNNIFDLNKKDSFNIKKILHLNNLNNYINIKDNNNNNASNNYHTTKNININKKINYNLHKNINKQNESNYSLEKIQTNSSIAFINNSFNNFNNVNNKNKKNLKLNGIYLNNSINNENIGKLSNNQLFKLNNNKINENRFVTLNNNNNNSLFESIDKYNFNKNQKKKDNDIYGYVKKVINPLIKKQNKNNLNYSLNNNNNEDNDIKLKRSIINLKGKKEINNLKANFINHLITKENKNINNGSYFKEKTKLNKKIKIHLNFNPIKKKTKNDVVNENIFLNNNRLSELINKYRKTKNKENKNDSDKKSNTKKSSINIQNNVSINQSNSLNNLKINNNFEKNNNCKSKQNNNNNTNNNISNYSSFSTRTKEGNEYMEQSIKLSRYIKNYYIKNNAYPQTNLDFYRIGRIIGQGGFAKVNLGLNVLTGRVVAIKSFNKTIKTKYGDNLNMDKILYEINLMRKLNHPNITKILETFEDDKFYFIIMEYINGGNLFSYVKKRRKLSEKTAKFLFKQIILGIKHIHSQLIVHRDIKLENILIDMNNNVKICDFGIGIILTSENQELHSHCGTPMYIAPEIILSNKEKGYMGFPVDIWSAGIALYIMLSGKLPFNLDEDQDDIDQYNKKEKEKNVKLKYEIVNKEPKYIEKISDEARNLLNGLLSKNPKKRLTCEQILNHPWLSDINNNKNHLFSKDERDTLSKTYIDYRKSKIDDLVENFTLSNLFNDKKNNDIEYNNIESKSSLLAPFNSLNYEFFNITHGDKNKNSKKDNFDDFYNKKIILEKDLLVYSNKAKELNFQYELNNNKEVDNGVLINSKSAACSSSSSYSNTNTFRNSNAKYFDFNYNYKEIENINEEKLERILSQMELMGYEREYIIKSVKNNYLNHASTVFFLLMQYEHL